MSDTVTLPTVTRTEAADMAAERMDAAISRAAAPLTQSEVVTHAVQAMREIKAATDVSLFVHFDGEGGAKFV